MPRPRRSAPAAAPTLSGEELAHRFNILKKEAERLALSTTRLACFFGLTYNQWLLSWILRSIVFTDNPIMRALEPKYQEILSRVFHTVNMLVLGNQDMNGWLVTAVEMQTIHRLQPHIPLPGHMHMYYDQAEAQRVFGEYMAFLQQLSQSPDAPSEHILGSASRLFTVMHAGCLQTASIMHLLGLSWIDPAIMLASFYGLPRLLGPSPMMRVLARPRHAFRGTETDLKKTGKTC